MHGLIRDLWASHGWERDPQLGYPITDELIPDERVGHRRPEVRKKLIVALPSDVIKLPADAAAAGFPLSVVNTPPVAASRVADVSMVAKSLDLTLAATNLSGAIGKLSGKSTQIATVSSGSTMLQPGSSTALNPVLATAGLAATPASTPADQRSVNRFADFESGVLFWFRGATAASMLSPMPSTTDGTPISFSGADIAAAAMSKIGISNIEAANVQLLSMGFVGTTGYSFDGAQVHNRRHKLQLILQGNESNSVGSVFDIAHPVTAVIELQVEVWFDAAQLRIVLAPTDWTLTQASSGSYATTVASTLRAKLAPLLWTSFELETLPDTDAGAPIAVLSVKTLPNGAVGVFVEPKANLVVTGVGLLAKAVTASTTVFAQPN